LHYLSSLVKVLILALLVPKVFAGECNNLKSLHWLAGKWQSNDNKIIEYWNLSARDELSGGANFYNEGGQKTSYETLRIILIDNQNFYIAKPKESKYPVPFKLTSCSENRFTFTNEQHDFPQIINYQKKSSHSFSVDVTDIKNKGFTVDYRKQKER